MADYSGQPQAGLLSDRDTTTPEQDQSIAEHHRKRQRPKRQRKRNAVSPGQIPSPVHSNGKPGGLRLHPIETSYSRGNKAGGFSEPKQHAFGKGEGKMAEVTFETTGSDEYLEGDITITSSYPSLKEISTPENVSDHKSSQKTHSTSLTSLSSASPRMQETMLGQRQRPGQENYFKRHPNLYGVESAEGYLGERPISNIAPRSSGLENVKRHAFWWEAYNARLVKPMSTCLLVSPMQRKNEMLRQPSPHHQIIDHFIGAYRTISFSNTKCNALLHDKQMDLEFVAKCLDAGVDIDQPDDAGQTVLMEAVRSWHLDVIRYLLENEAKVTHQDTFGRAPIHIAAAANRPAVIHLLLDQGAFVNLKIRHSGETPLHLAARRGALLSIEALLERKAELEANDYKGRTPLHIAAEFGRSDMVDLLLKSGASPANVNDNGFSCLTHIVMTCPDNVVDKALDKLIQHSDMSEKLLFDPVLFETCPEGWRDKVGTNFLLDVIESNECAPAVRHTVIQTLIKTRWIMFGRLWALVNFFLRFLFFAVWTGWILAIHWEDKHKYDWQHHWWRAVLPTFGVFFLFWEIKIELLEARYSILRGVTLATTQLVSLQDDLKHLTHPCWKDEQDIIQDKLNTMRKLTHWWRQMGLYSRDLWNIYDFLIFTVVLICMFTHISDSINHDLGKARTHGQLGSVTILLLGIRLMKDTRGFFGPGQLVIMLGLMALDFGRFIFLYLQLYFPFTIAFWIIFGGVRHPYNELCQFNCSALANCSGNCTSNSFVTNVCDLDLPNCVSNRTNVFVTGMESYPSLCFSLFRLTLVDEYDLDTMRLIDPMMSLVLVSAFLLTSAVVGINFLIGLISNVLGDGARENVEVKSLLQKLRVILLIEQTPYICGPRPDQLSHNLTMKHHELDFIKDFKRDNNFSIREGIAEVNKGMARLKKIMTDIHEQHDVLLNHCHQLQGFVQQLNQNKHSRNGGHQVGSDSVDGHAKGSAFSANPLLLRTMSRAAKCRRDLNLSVNYSKKTRDVDEDEDWRLTQPRISNGRQSVVNIRKRSRSASPMKRIKVKD